MRLDSPPLRGQPADGVATSQARAKFLATVSAGSGFLVCPTSGVSKLIIDIGAQKTSQITSTLLGRSEYAFGCPKIIIVTEPNERWLRPQPQLVSSLD